MKHKNLKVLAKCDLNGTEARLRLLVEAIHDRDLKDAADYIEQAWNLSLVQHGVESVVRHSKIVEDTQSFVNKSILGI